MTNLEIKYYEEIVRECSKCAVKLYKMGWHDAMNTNFVKMNDHRNKLGLKDIPTIEMLVENRLLAEVGFKILKPEE